MPVTIVSVRKVAMSFPEVEEKPHFNIPSFRYKNKIFATLWAKEKRVMVKLPMIEQSVFCSYDNSTFYPVPGGWGKQGATFVELKSVRSDMLKDALLVAYNNILNKSDKPRIT